MHYSVTLMAFASLALGLPAGLTGYKLLPRDGECGSLNKIPLSPDPSHSSYTFTLDPSVQQVVSNNTQNGMSFNTIWVDQYCNKFGGDGGYEAHNKGFTNITEFGPDSKYDVATDKCEDGESRSPLSYTIGLCHGDGTECTTNSPWAQCGTPGIAGDYRAFCAVTEPDGGNPKAISLTDPTAWSCEVCTTSSRYCTWG
ncbi:hypothetical protein LX32DRAFT_670689 [Colletotrichum zoysiae]|uniref:Uncharacterized protein n=1 Tax=Colletotrichum zoysiae TaxID=1216348 RepID=A0AAD9HR50_9PEZI|nr:hypothetical protein LX32DRAFT_670689 [Colletotrichum zoysiae]